MAVLPEEFGRTAIFYTGDEVPPMVQEKLSSYGNWLDQNPLLVVKGQWRQDSLLLNLCRGICGKIL
jgi:hypothetical protein